MKKLSTIVIVFSMFLGLNSKAQNLENKIDSLILEILKDKNGPGAIFLVAKDGKPIYQKAFGKANLELSSDIKTESVFQIGSMTKQFTAINILILEELGKLNINDTISKYIPDYPVGNKITIQHLLTHTSGIKDFNKIKAVRDIAHKDLSTKEMVDYFKNEPMDFIPGEKFEYNNSGYVLLGYITEIVSGKSYEQNINENIFKKIGMNNSRFGSDREIVANRAYGYHKKETGYVNKTRISFTIPISAGSLMSNASDMLKWQNALNTSILAKPETIKRAFSKNTLNNGQEISYGYGWHLKDLKGIPIIEHGGSIFGFKSMGVYIPSEDIYVLGLSNCDCNSPTELTRNIAAVVLDSIKPTLIKK